MYEVGNIVLALLVVLLYLYRVRKSLYGDVKETGKINSEEESLREADT